MCGKTWLNSPNFNLFPRTIISHKKHFPRSKIPHKKFAPTHNCSLLYLASWTTTRSGAWTRPACPTCPSWSRSPSTPTTSPPCPATWWPGCPGFYFSFEKSSFPHKKYFPPDCKAWGWSTTSCLATAGSPGFSTMRHLLPLPGACLSPCFCGSTHMRRAWW